MENQNGKKNFLHALKNALLTDISIILFVQLSFFLISTVFSAIFRNMSRIDIPTAYIISVFGLLYYLRQSKLMLSYNSELSKKFYNETRDGEKKNFFSKFVFPFKTLEFWVEFLLFSLFILCIPIKIINYPAFLIFKTKSSAIAFLIPAVFLCVLFAFYFSFRDWTENKGTVKSEKSFRRESQSSAVLLLTLALFAVLITVLLINYGALMKIETQITILLWVVGVIFAIVIFYSLRAFMKRRAFLKSLKNLIDEKQKSGENYSISEIKNKNRLFLPLKDGEDFRVFDGKEYFSCKMISCRRPRVPLLIAGEGKYSFIHAVKLMKYTVYEFISRHKYNFESENKKVLILCPSPKQVFALNDEERQICDNGVEAFGLFVYSAGAFINALDRKTIGKKEKKY